MPVIDAHQHFWKFDPVRDSWINDEMKAIQKDFLPGDLEPLLQRLGIDGTVVVQSDQSEAETQFQLANAGDHAFIKGVVGWIDLQAENLEEKLIYYKQYAKLKGFRHVLQGEKDRAFMLRPAFKKGISLLASFGFSYDLLIYPDQLAYSRELVASFPDQQFVIDHLAKPAIKDVSIDSWAADIRAIAKYGNVHCKVSGMITEADWKNWKAEEFTPYLDVIVEAFGMKRLIYGSDWPVCLVAGSYEQVLELVRKYFSSFSLEEQDDFFAHNATRFYQLNKR